MVVDVPGGADGAVPLSKFDYELPAAAVAQVPVEPRDASRLMHLGADATTPLAHYAFRELPTLLSPGDLLVVNRTRVLPARLHVRRPTGGRVELLFVRPVDGNLAGGCAWEALGRPGSALKAGAELLASGGERLRVEQRIGDTALIRATEPVASLLARHGEVPLPPYIERPEGPSAADAESYQSIFAQDPGAVAAPTASLHFTPQVMESLRVRGVRTAEVVLHVGPGTFLPVRSEHANDVRQHVMHQEWYDVPRATSEAIAQTHAAHGRVVAVGTTSVRALEAFATSGRASGMTQIFIRPGHEFRFVDGLVTNFHLPRSTLLMLVAAMAGRERVLDAYRVALASGYRFFSYGDAMLVWRQGAAARGVHDA